MYSQNNARQQSLRIRPRNELEWQRRLALYAQEVIAKQCALAEQLLRWRLLQCGQRFSE